METSLPVVDDVFLIEGRGVVVALSLPAAEGWHIKVRDAVTFQRPDGSVFRTTIRGLDVPRTNPPFRFLGVLLGPEITSKDLVPVGTKLLSVDALPEPAPQV